MIIRWTQHRIRPNAPQHVVLSGNVVKGYYSAPLIVISDEPISAGTMLAAKHVRRSMMRYR